MKKIVLGLFVAAMSLAAVSSYASTEMSAASTKNTTVQAGNSDINAGPVFNFKDTNLYPDPRVNNK